MVVVVVVAVAGTSPTATATATARSATTTTAHRSNWVRASAVERRLVLPPSAVSLRLPRNQGPGSALGSAFPLENQNVFAAEVPGEYLAESPVARGSGLRGARDDRQP